MRGRIITSEHETWELPELLSWDLLRTGSVPCDSFEALCPYTAEMAEAAHLAVSFLLLEGERLLLHGIVDEVVTEETAERGRTVRFRGRGYAARLLDNESPPLVYQGVTLREILRRHVTPYGIRCRERAETKAEGEFTVAAGSSQCWRTSAGSTGASRPALTGMGSCLPCRRGIAGSGWSSTTGRSF